MRFRLAALLPVVLAATAFAAPIANAADIVPPAAPARVTATAAQAKGSRATVMISWGATLTAWNYNVYRDGAYIGTVRWGQGRTYLDADLRLITGTTYTYAVRALDYAGNMGAPSEVAVTTPGVSPGAKPAPYLGEGFTELAAPRNVTVTGGVGSASVAWTFGGADRATMFFDWVPSNTAVVYRDGVVVGRVAKYSRVAPVIVDKGAGPGAHVYAVREEDTLGQMGPAVTATVTLTKCVATRTATKPVC